MTPVRQTNASVTLLDVCRSRREAHWGFVLNAMLELNAWPLHRNRNVQREASASKQMHKTVVKTMRTVVPHRTPLALTGVGVTVKLSFARLPHYDLGAHQPHSLRFTPSPAKTHRHGRVDNTPPCHRAAKLSDGEANTNRRN